MYNYQPQGQQPYGQQPYGQQPYQQAYRPMPVRQLKTDRSLLLYILLNMVTFGIYGIVLMSGVSTDINEIASRYDGKKTSHYCLMVFLLSWLTFGIYPLVWYHGLSERVGNELRRRGIIYDFGSGTYWGWGFFGALLFGIGPLVYTHKLFHAMNLLSGHYNVNG